MPPRTFYWASLPKRSIPSQGKPNSPCRNPLYEFVWVLYRHVSFFSTLPGVWRCISPSWILTSTASGWARCWNTPRTPCRSMQTRTMVETARRTTPATCWHLTATRSTCVCLGPSTQAKTLTISHLRMKGELQGAGRGPVHVTTTRRANPIDLAAYPPCRSTTNWIAWGCGWKG